jgi:nucleotide-binding universal stress UspA family protein
MDGSKEANKAAKRVKDLLQPNTITKIVAFHSINDRILPKIASFTVPTPYSGPEMSVNGSPERIKSEYRMMGETILDNTKKLFAKDEKLIETRLIEDEDPEDYILRTVEKEDFDLVALGSRGDTSKLKEIFMGSVAKKVLDEADCDVLVVR